MKKLLFILAFTVQLVNAQTTPETGEYISIEKFSPGINLKLNNDKTFQLFVFNGTYDVVNDSIVFNESLESQQKASFNVTFSKNKTDHKKLKFSVKPSLMLGLRNEFLGIQSKENGEIIYASIYDYIKKNNEDDELRDAYRENEEDFSFSFELDKPYAIYLALENKTETKIEKYIIQPSSTEVMIESNFSLFENIKLAGSINTDKSLNVYIDRKPMKFVNKQHQTQNILFEKPASKIVEKNWSFPGKKNPFNIYDDSTVVVADTAMVDYEEGFEFKAKIETNFKEALLNLKKDTLTKYLFVYYNLNDKKAEKNFNYMIEEYNMNMGNNMYSGYDAENDRYNFYFATKTDEAFLKKNNVKDNSVLIINKDGKILASSTKKIRIISNGLNYYQESIYNKLKETENAILLSNSISNKKTSVPDLAKSLNNNYRDFLKESYYYYQINVAVDTVAAMAIDTRETMEAEDAPAIVEAVETLENTDFTYYKSDISEKILAEKLNVIFEYYNSKNIINNELVNILLGEISGNHTSFDLFKNENDTNNKQEIKYINYILKYNETEKNKTKIASIINDLIAGKQANNPDIKTYNAIRMSLISYTENNFEILQSVISDLNEQTSGSEEANKLVDLYYNTLINDKPLFENIDAQFSNSNEDVDYTTDWSGFKSKINRMLNTQAWDIFEMNKTKDFERAIKWSELSNLVDKNNANSLDTLGQLYFAVGRKSEAIAIQTKAVALAKESKMNFEEFEKVLNNMKK